MPKRAWLVALVLALLQVPWLTRPVHYDEANFLVLARGAVEDPWRPHDVRINWQGREERAFDVLSNPPGIAWWLAPLQRAPVPVQRAWMLAWLPLAVFGAWKLGRRFLGDGAAGALLLGTAPIVLLSTPALLPDAPLWALTLAGVGGFIDAVDRGRPAGRWALLAGTAALFRYSGVVLAPVLASYLLFARYGAPGRPDGGRRPSPQASPGEARDREDGRPAPLWAFLPVFAPISLLALHDLHAYGAVHLLAMGRFQSVADTPDEVGHKFVASIAMLGGAAALPVFRWELANLVGAALGAAVGAPWGWPGIAFAAAGGASLAELRRERFLGLWALAGMAFLATLRFAATRYWLPFLAPVLLVRRGWKPTILAQVVLGTLLAADEMQSAEAQVELADQVSQLGTGRFTGHWGWQWAMEQRGWHAAEEGERPDGLVAMPRQAWPQPVDVACNRIVWEGEAEPPYPWLPRGYTEAGGANLHAGWIAGPPMRSTIAPWTFASDPYERVRVCAE